MKLATCNFPLFVAFVASSFQVSHALTNIVVSWGIPLEAGSPYPSQKAQVGDIVTFKWGANSPNNVHIYPSGTCEEDESIFIGDESEGTSYRFKEEDVGEIFFTSDTPGSCEAGQTITFIVSTSDVSPTNLVIDSESVTTITTYFDFVTSIWDGVGTALPDTFGNPFVFEDDPNTLVQLFALEGLDLAPEGEVGEKEEEEEELGFFARIFCFIFRIITLPFRFLVNVINGVFGLDIGAGGEDAEGDDGWIFGRFFEFIFRIISLPFRLLMAGVGAVVNPIMEIFGVDEGLAEVDVGGEEVMEDGVWIFRRIFCFIFRIVSLPFRLLIAGVQGVSSAVSTTVDNLLN